LHEVTLVAALEDGWVEAARALALPMPPVALELTSEGRLLARLAGTQEAVRRIARELGWPEAREDVWSDHAMRGGSTWARISVPPRRLRDVVGRLPGEAKWWASPGVGVAHWVGDLDADSVWLARRAAEQAGGGLVLIAAPVELKRQVGAWGTAPATPAWMTSLRDAFDPRRTLSPGRYMT